MRRELRGTLAALAAPDVRTRSDAICNKLMKSAYVACARCVMLYAPMPGEVDVGPVIRRCLDARLKVCLPRTGWDSGVMDPALVADWPTGMVETRHGLMQPPDNASLIELESIDLVVVPGLAFDRHGARLGRGGGFYDRFLARRGLTALRVGVAFDAQIVDSIPVRREEAMSGTLPGLEIEYLGPYVPDARVHAVFTDRRILLGTDPYAPGNIRTTETTG